MQSAGHHETWSQDEGTCACMVRVTRHKAGLTQKQVAEKMGIKTLSTCQKLEASKTANPEWLTIVRLKQALPAFPLELCAA